MNKTVKHIVEGFDFGNISNDNPSKNITRNLRRSIDDYINEKGYIVPGMGDAGDRIFNT